MTAIDSRIMTPLSDLPKLLSSRGLDVRRETDGSRWYCDPDTDQLLASVTTVLSATSSKPWLTPWAAKLAATFAVEQHDLVSQTLAAAGPAAAIDLIKGAAARKRDEASSRGTWLHDVVEALVLDAPLPDFPDDVVPFADAFVDWCCDWEPEFIAAECTVADPLLGWAGTLDLILRFPRWPFLGTWLIDAKSGANLDHNMPVQLATYKRATEVWLPLGRKAPMPQVDRCAVLHVRPEGAKFIDVTEFVTDDAYNRFLRMRAELDAREALPKHIGRVLYPPLPDGSQPPPLLEDLPGAPCVAILREAGVVRLADLTSWTRDGLLNLKGIGAKKADAIEEFLTEHGLTLATVIEQAS